MHTLRKPVILKTSTAQGCAAKQYQAAACTCSGNTIGSEGQVAAVCLQFQQRSCNSNVTLGPKSTVSVHQKDQILLPPVLLSLCRHYKLWEDLRLDYEIERRFDAINRKLGPMLENAKFLLDVRAEQKSSGAEWIIIGLICLEVLMNGFGHLAAYLW